MISVISQLQQDCSIILDRVLTGQHLTFFGEDGNGRYGRSTFPVTGMVRSFFVEIDSYSDDLSCVDAYVYIFLHNYSAAAQGHAITDNNLRISLNLLLSGADVEPSALDWGPLDLQTEDRIALKVDVKKLLAW